MEDPQFIQTIRNLEFDVAYRNSADTKAYLDDAYKRFSEMLQKTGFKKD